jgi:hypothetical protein
MEIVGVLQMLTSFLEFVKLAIILSLALGSSHMFFLE